MNRNKLYWSVMGNEVSESSARKEDFEKFNKQIEIMFGKYGTREVLRQVRKAHDNHVEKVEKEGER